MTRGFAGFVGALQLLTRLPVGRLPAAEGGAWAWPVVGMLLGAIAGGVDWAARLLGCPPALAAAWTLAAQVLLTGGLHEDGLADTADGFGGGATAARKLDIMRDSRIGSFGALALVLSLAVRGTAIAGIAAPGVALIVAGALGRAAMVLARLSSPPARPDGMAARLPAPRAGTSAVALGLAAVCALVLVPARMAALLLAATAAISLGMARLAVRQVGGHTGDVLGAVEVATECVVLSLLSAGAIG